MPTRQLQSASLAVVSLTSAAAVVSARTGAGEGPAVSRTPLLQSVRPIAQSVVPSAYGKHTPPE